MKKSLSLSVLSCALVLTGCGEDPSSLSSSSSSSVLSSSISSSSVLSSSSFSSSVLSSSSFSSSVVSSSSSSSALFLQDVKSGQCRVDGDPSEAVHGGYTGEGYANVTNSEGAKIVWSINVESSGPYTLEFRFANGADDNRSGELSVNSGSGGELTLSLPATVGSWTTWQKEVLKVDLVQGQNIVELSAKGEEGLANIDYLKVIGNGVTVGSCEGLLSSDLSSVSSSSSLPASSASSSSSSNNSSSTSKDPRVTGCNGESSGLSANKIHYVTPSGGGTGASFNSPMNFKSAISAVKAGEMILLKPGTYTIPYSGGKNSISLSKSGTSNAPIIMTAANCGRAVFDFSWPKNRWTKTKSVGFDHTGSYWYLKNIDITNAGYQGIYIKGSHNTIENARFYHNRNSGLEINNGGSHNTVINTDSYENYDLKVRDNDTHAGQMADGFASKQSQGAGNKFYGCRAWSNSDDGFDTYDSDDAVIIRDSYAFKNGINIWGDVWKNIIDDNGKKYSVTYEGNGNGFKLGGKSQVQNNVITNSIAFGNPGKGFDQNNNAGGMTVWNNISYDNGGDNFGFGGSLKSGQKHDFRNNISLSGSHTVKNANASNNSWDSNVTVNSSDFISLDTSKATVKRNLDGTLPSTDLFRLKAGSDLIDAGKGVGLPYDGSAPDLGVFERE